MNRCEMVRLFVGENPSSTAIRKGWFWTDGRLAAAQLFEGLRRCGIDPEKQQFLNLFNESGKDIDQEVVERVNRWVHDGLEVVGMGKKVQVALRNLGIAHLGIVHPAARGIIRKKENYTLMLKRQLCVECKYANKCEGGGDN